MAGGSGLVTAASLIEGMGASSVARQRCKEIEAELRAEIDELGLDIYPLAVAAPNVAEGDGDAGAILGRWADPHRTRCFLNWLSEESAESAAAAERWYARMLSGAVRLGQHVVVLATDEANWERLEKQSSEERRIDIWWFGDESSRLMLLLAHLMTRTDSWADATLRVLVPTPAEAEAQIADAVAQRIDEFRIDAEVEAVPDPDLARVRESSESAALVMMPLRLQGMRLADPFGFGVSALVEGLPALALVAAAQDVQLSDEAAMPAPADAAESEQEPEPVEAETA